MAVRRRTYKRKTGSRRKSRRNGMNIEVDPSIAREIWAIIYFAVGLLTVLSIQGAFGIVGDAWVSLLRPILGWGLYGIPAVFILVALMMFFSKKVEFGAARVFGILILVTSVLSVVHLSVPIEEIHNYAAQGQYGGYVGFVTNFLLLEVLGIGRVGATIVFVAMFLVSILLVFELSLRQIAGIFIPRIRIEVMKNGNKDEEEEDDEEKDVEDLDEDLLHGIMIHKAAIGKSAGDTDTIYEDEEEAEKQKAREIKISPKKERDLSAQLSKSEKAAEEKSEDYEWEFPSLDLLKEGDSAVAVDDEVLMENADKIKKKLLQFDIGVTMHEVNVGPTVIQYTLKPSEGVKLSKIIGLKDDLALALAAERIRIEAPIPGKSLVGIEVPNPTRATVYLRELLESKAFKDSKSKLTLPLGRDVSGKPMLARLEEMPHLLVAGATGTGKSVAMNSFLISLLYQNSPWELKFIIIDPKRVELNYYNSIPHLLTPVIQDPEKAAISLRWVVAEMTRRYGELTAHRVRNIAEFNELEDISKLPRIVVVIDELAELMMVAGKEVEALICRIAQLARAVGIHLIIATQRPSVDVVTGLIKANLPTRISFAVRSQIDSRTILDAPGAEDLLGKGDMLYLPQGKAPVRIQGVFVSTEEIEKVTNRLKLTEEPDYDEGVISNDTAGQRLAGVPDSKAGESDDELYEAAFELVKETRKASASLFQRRLKVGYARAARLIDLLEQNGIVGPADGAKARRINFE